MTERTIVVPLLNESAEPLVVRIEAAAVEHAIAPGHVAFVVASGSAQGMLDVTRAAGKVTLRAAADAAGSSIAVASERIAPVERDLETYLTRVAHLFEDTTGGHRALFAALLAERRGRVLRAGDPPMDEVLDALWSAAAVGRMLTDDVAAKCGARVRDATSLVDVDRADAFATYRLLDVFARALQCASEAPLERALDLAAAFLGAAADVSHADARAPELLRARWSWGRVQQDARWLGVVIDALGAAAHVDGAVVKAMRAALLALDPPAPAFPAPSPAVAATRAQPSAKPVPKPAPVAVREATAAASPNVVPLRIAGRTATFVEVSPDRYRVEVDGEARRLRTRLRHQYVHEGGSAGARDDVSPPWVESDVANVTPLLECLANDAARTEDAACVTLRAQFQWGHYRQNRWIEARVAIAEDGAVVVDFDVATQDDSYY